MKINKKLGTKRIAIIDIECYYDKKSSISFETVVATGSNEIQMIGHYDNFKHKFYSFFYKQEMDVKTPEKHKNLKILMSKRFGTKKFEIVDGVFKSPESNIEYPCLYLYFTVEKIMLESYMKFIKDISPDIWDGFFVEAFDLTYIINRCKTLNVDYRKLSPLGQVYVSYGDAKLRGSIIWDLARNYAKWLGSHRHANSLKKLSESHLKSKEGKKMTKTSESIIDENWYMEDIPKFIEYCLVDVELVLLLEQELGLIEIADRFVKFSGVNPDFVRLDSHIIESLFCFLKSLYESQILNNQFKIVFTTKREQDIETASGADVFNSMRGLYTTGVILIMDLSKMYPKIVISVNISPETIRYELDPKEVSKYIHCIANNVYYRKDRVGFVPFAFQFLFKIRKEVEDERDQYEYNTPKYNAMNGKRQTVKDTVNAVTGQFDYNKSIIINVPCADSIRMTGKKELGISRDETYHFFETTGIRGSVIYGDTDSIFVYLNDVNDVEIAIEIGKELTKWIQTGYDKFAKDMNIDNHEFEIGLETIMDVFLSTGKKKKYFGHLVWVDGKYITDESRSLYIKGFEMKRSDSAELTGEVQKAIFSIVNKSRNLSKEEIKKRIIAKIKSYKDIFTEDNFLYIGIPKKMKKPFDRYKVRNPWLDGCKFMNRYFNADFGMGSKPKLIYVKGIKPMKQSFKVKQEFENGTLVEYETNRLPHTSAICVEEGMEIPEGMFIIDKEKMLRKTVIEKLDKVLPVIGIDEDEIFEGYKKMNLMDYMKNLSGDSGNSELYPDVDLEQLKIIKELSYLNLIEYRKELGLSEKIEEVNILK